MPLVERALVAAGLAGALLASRLLPGFPVEWRAILVLAVLGLALWSAPVGYFAAVAVTAYPIWQFSPYLMVLFLGLAIIPHRLILAPLPLALLIVWSPAFISLHMELALPILVGLLGGVGRAGQPGRREQAGPGDASEVVAEEHQAIGRVEVVAVVELLGRRGPGVVHLQHGQVVALRPAHHPRGAREDDRQLHEGVLAADGLVGPRRAITGAFQPANRLALQIGG